MTNRTKGKCIKGLALFLDIWAPFMAACTQFPIWVEKSSGATISGLFVIFALLSAIPAVRYFKNKHKTPSSALMWSIFFVVLLALSKIIDQMLAVCFIGMVANIVGSLMYKLGAIIELRPDLPDEEGEENE